MPIHYEKKSSSASSNIVAIAPPHPCLGGSMHDYIVSNIYHYLKSHTIYRFNYSKFLSIFPRIWGDLSDVDEMIFSIIFREIDNMPLYSGDIQEYLEILRDFKTKIDEYSNDDNSKDGNTTNTLNERAEGISARVENTVTFPKSHKIYLLGYSHGALQVSHWLYSRQDIIEFLKINLKIEIHIICISPPVQHFICRSILNYHVRHFWSVCDILHGIVIGTDDCFSPDFLNEYSKRSRRNTRVITIPDCGHFYENEESVVLLLKSLADLIT